MPGKNFYRQYPTLSAKVQQFIFHHSGAEVRHISKYEAEMLTDVVRELQILQSDRVWNTNERRS